MKSVCTINGCADAELVMYLHRYAKSALRSQSTISRFFFVATLASLMFLVSYFVFKHFAALLLHSSKFIKKYQKI